MNGGNWEKAKEIFGEAIKLAPAARPLFLDAVCADDAALREEVESLLASLETAESFMETPLLGARSDTRKIGRIDRETGFGHYDIIERLGAGGMGEVYLARDKKLDRRVAVKILNEKFSRDESSLLRFVREAKAASALNHPNILTIHEIGESNGSHYIVGEYVEGRTLRSILGQDALELPEVLEIAIQVARALAAAHEAGIIHRDIKPENIMVRPDGYVKILDFGLAKLISAEQPPVAADGSTKSTDETAEGVILGTVNYMSPEQAKGEPINAQTDIFSLGVVLYEMISGKTPFRGKTLGETYANLIHAEASFALSAEKPANEWQLIVSKMLAKAKIERYRTMSDAAADLESLRKLLEFNGEPDPAARAVKPAEKTQSLKITAGNRKENPTRTDKIRWLMYALSTPKRRFAAAGGLILISLAAVFFYIPASVRRPAESEPISSIAVLPLKNLTGEAANDYLCDGIAESLIGSLSKISNLRVIARNSTFAYKERELDYSEIGRRLNVESILTGSVRRENNDLRANVRLIKVDDGRVLWTRELLKPASEIFAIRDEIARDVAARLNLKIDGVTQQNLIRHETENVEAYQLYLEGRYLFHQQNEESLNKSIEYFNRAIAKDAGYASAYSGLADVYSSLGFYFRAPNEVMPKAGYLAGKALALDEASANAHLSAAQVKFWYELDFPATEREVRCALEFEPNNSPAHWLYGDYLMAAGDSERGLAEIERAVELDPLAHAARCDLGFQYYNARQYERAIDQARRNLEMVESCPFDYLWIGQSLGQKGRYADAVAELDKVDRHSKQWAPALAEKGYAYARLGKRAKAREILRSLKALSERKFVDPYGMAIVYFGLDDREATLAWLEKAYRERSPNLPFLKIDPKFDGLRDDQRFQELLRRIGSFG